MLKSKNILLPILVLSLLMGCESLTTPSQAAPQSLRDISNECPEQLPQVTDPTMGGLVLWGADVIGIYKQCRAHAAALAKASGSE